MIRLLYITHRVPYPCDKGERIRCTNILRALSNHACVDLISLADEFVHPEARSFLLRYAQNFYVVPIGRLSKYLRMIFALCSGRSLSERAFAVPSAKQLVRTLLDKNRYDVVLLSSSAIFPLVADLPRQVRLIADIMDVDSRKWRAYAHGSFWFRPLYLRESTLVGRLERSIVNRAHAVIVTTLKELEYLPSGSSYKLAVGNGVDCGFFAPRTWPSECLARLAFLGTLDYWPNIDAISRFVNAIWPHVRKSLPQATFNIAGRRPSTHVLRLAQAPGVNLYRDVPDVRPILDQCGLAVFPLKLVFGIPNKVLEAMAMARLCIIPPEIASIIGGQAGVHYLVANTAEEWLHHILEAQSNPVTADRIGQNARNFVAECYSWDIQLRRLIEFILIRQAQLQVAQYV
ncbi:hypothetical protein HRbin36_00026 [bacterium HR36]|nr:hypothetical protein HRbin36_00026 [bacterium HR36]